MRAQFLTRERRRLIISASLAALIGSAGAAIGAGFTAGTNDSAMPQGQSGFPLPPATIQASEPAPILVAQSSRDIGTMNVKIAQLEEQVRLLTGQVEGLQFQLAQMQTYIERLQEDYDARLAALEGGTAPGKTSAVTQPNGATPSGGLPPTIDPVVPQGEYVTEDDIIFDPIAEGYGEDSRDPLVLGGSGQPLGTLGVDSIDLSKQPLDLTNDSGSLVSDADADAQYRAGYDAVLRGDYSFAEDQFRQFIALFPQHRLAPEATNWLGEALILRGANDEAADVLLHGFQTYPNSERAPDLLLKLGIALSAADERDTACRTFGEVVRRFPDMPNSFKQRLNQEMDKATC